MRRTTKVGLGILGLAACLVLVGCASGKVKVAALAPRAAMEKYNTCAVCVINDAGTKCPDEVAPNLQASAINQLLEKHPNVFTEVRPTPTGAEDELLVEVHITKYKKGSRFARAMLIGLGASKISSDVNFLDSATKEKLTSGQLNLTWAMGGVVGASKGIEDLVNDAGRKVANAIVEQRTGVAPKK